MNISKKTMKGFSLVEVLISLAIIAIMTGTLLMTGNNKSKQEVQLAAREIAAQLRLLQNDVLNGKVIGGKIICKTEMNFKTGNDENKYEMKYYTGDCDSGGTEVKTETFFPKKSKINLGEATEGSISFMAPLGKVDYSTLGGPNGILLQSERNLNQKMTVCVNDAGNIEEIKDENRYCAGVGCDIKNGTSCTMTNDCHSSNTGTYNCLGNCSVSAPPNPSFLNQPCDSQANNCGSVNHGFRDCDNNCSATRPPDSPPVSCSSTSNSCGSVRLGTSVCGQQCSAVGDNSGCGTYLKWSDTGVFMIGGAWFPPRAGTIQAPFNTWLGCGFVQPCNMTCDRSKTYWNYCLDLNMALIYYCYSTCN